MVDRNGDGIDDGTGTVAPYNPSIPTGGGYSTNLVAQSAAQAQAETPIFAGWQRGHADDVRGSGEAPPRLRVMLTPTQLLSAYDGFSREDFLRLRNLLTASGFVGAGADPVEVRNAYAGVIDEVSNMSSRGITLSPMGFIKNLIRMNGLDPSDVGTDPDYDPFGTATAPDPNRTQTYTQRTISDIDEGEAWSSVQGVVSQMLGRDPSDQETRDFTYRMGQLAARNPSVSKTTTTYKDGEVADTSTHTTPGFTSADMAHEAYDNAQADPEYAEYRSASTYFNALQSALGPIGG